MKKTEKKELQIKRNELHFHIQRKFRMNIVESKKTYNRKRLPKIYYWFIVLWYNVYT